MQMKKRVGVCATIGLICLLMEVQGHSDPSFRESVIRNRDGLMVMKLSPRGGRGAGLLQQLNNNGKGIVDVGEQNTRRHSARAGILHLFTKPEKKDAPLENQSESKVEDESNNYASSSSSSSSPTRHDHEESKLRSYSGGGLVSDEFLGSDDNENESQFSSQQLRNSSYDGGEPEIGQVLVSSKDDVEEGAENELQRLMAGFLKREIWTIPLLVLASLNMVLVAFFEIYVLCRTKRESSRAHLFLGQMLLFSIFLCSTLALFFAMYPSTLICYMFRIGIGLGYSLMFSVLLVKSLYLLSLDAGYYLPAMVQGSLLFFSVLVQTGLDVQWALLHPPLFQVGVGSEREDSVFLQCGTSYPQMIYSLGYPAFLFLLVGYLSAKATFRGIKENYRESVYILISVVVSGPIAISWILGGWILEGRQLAAMGKDLGYDEDDQFSRYSPSFFHFKPSSSSKGGCKGGVFGDGNLYTTLEPTLSTINPNVFFTRSDYHSGMFY